MRLNLGVLEILTVDEIAQDQLPLYRVTSVSAHGEFTEAFCEER
jgi:hypothetical protein